MAEYIERDAAIAVINSMKGPTRSPAQNNMIREMLVKMDYASAADVAPVVHGRWVWDCGKPTCNICANEPYRASDAELPKYCPNCGAKMDLEG